MTQTTLNTRQQLVFTLLAGLFIGTLGFVNLLGISHFIDFSFKIGSFEIPMMVPVGALPYPCTFLCINIICELFGKTRANHVVYAGLLVNIWILFFIWVAGLLPSSIQNEYDIVFYKIRQMTMGAITASMTAYFISQLLDIHLFQYWRKLTRGSHLWLRSNGSTLISQFIDTAIVISLTFFFTNIYPESSHTINVLPFIIISSYTYKVMAAVFGTIPFYIAVITLKRFLSESDTSDKISMKSYAT
jgi:uncharacterized integral membrane protein (TIGR00697 family)